MKVYVNITQEVEIPDHFPELADYVEWDENTLRPLHNEFCTTIENIMGMPLSSREAAKNANKSIESVYTVDWKCCLLET